ncbi:unnamed protein product, partial [Rotaria magnacalcarata]
PTQLLTIHQTGQSIPTSASPTLSPLNSMSSLANSSNDYLCQMFNGAHDLQQDFLKTSPPSTQTDPSLTDNPEYLSQLLKDKRQLAAVPN